MANDKEQLIGWAFEATPETSPITTNTSKWWLFGKMTTDLEKFEHPTELHNWQPVYKATQKNPDELELQDTRFGGGYAFYPVNLIPFYMVMGASSSDGSTPPIHTITNINSGNVETLTIRTESLTTGASNDKVFEALGNKATMLSGYFDLSLGYKKMSQVINIDGIKTHTPTVNAKHTNGPRYPTNDGTWKTGGSSTTFGYDTNAAFHWDSSGDDINYTADLINFTYKITNYSNIGGISNQAEPEDIDAGNFEYAFTLTLKRGTDNSIREDFEAKTLHDMYLTLYAGATNNVTLTWDDVGLIECKANAPLRAGELRTWFCKGIAENLTITGQDNCSKTEFFGE